VIRGQKPKAGPEAWRIIDGKLYLNLNKDLLAEWSKDPARSRREGDAQWRKIKDSPPG